MNLVRSSHNYFAPAISALSLALFWFTVAQQNLVITEQVEQPAAIVVSEPIQVLLYGGDRFLAANIESIRAMAAATTEGAENYRLRAHTAVSHLNPCHEDNYWIGNASLSWGGAEEQGLELLRNAIRCRYWDEWPAFFYGFNQDFFLKNIAEARRALELAAQRSPNNAAVFRNFSIMLKAGEINDTKMAVEMLTKEHDEAKDKKLKEMLNQRITRLTGLLSLRNAQQAFEKKFGKPLQQPQELLETGLLDAFPEDPLRIGYEFRDNAFHLRQLKMQ